MTDILARGGIRYGGGPPASPLLRVVRQVANIAQRLVAVEPKVARAEQRVIDLEARMANNEARIAELEVARTTTTGRRLLLPGDA